MAEEPTPAFVQAFIEEMDGLQRDMKEQYRRHAAYFLGKPDWRPPTRRERLRWKTREFTRSSRQRLALFIAPWLDEGY